MSYIEFQTPDDRTRISGAERHWMGRIVNRVARAIFEPHDYPSSPCWTRSLLPPGHYLEKQVGHVYEQGAELWLFIGARDMVHPVTRTPVDAFAVVLNTAMRLGSDEVRLMARLHGQCEIHAFIPPEEAEPVAAIIESGRASGLYRPEMGWEDVAALIRDAGKNGQHVVTHYSVTDSFPGWDPETRAPRDWEASVAALHPTLAIRPGNFAQYQFGDGTDLMKLRRAYDEAKTAKEGER